MTSDPLRFSASYRVRFDEAGPDGLLRTSNLLRYAQDVAWRHSEARGFDRAWYAKRGVGWVVRSAAIDLAARIPLGADVAITTEVAGYQRIWARRRATCRLAGGSVAATIQTDWVLVDDRGRLARVPAEIIEAFPAPLLAGSLLRVPLGDAPPGVEAVAIRVRPHEIDPMNHANNAVYVDWLEERLLHAGPAGEAVVRATPRGLRLEYAMAAAPDAEVIARTWPDTIGWACRLSDARGADLLRATVVADHQTRPFRTGGHRDRDLRVP